MNTSSVVNIENSDKKEDSKKIYSVSVLPVPLSNDKPGKKLHYYCNDPTSIIFYKDAPFELFFDYKKFNVYLNNGLLYMSSWVVLFDYFNKSNFDFLIKSFTDIVIDINNIRYVFKYSVYIKCVDFIAMNIIVLKLKPNKYYTRSIK